MAVSDFNTLISSTIRKHMPRVVDQVIADQIILAMLGHRDLAPALVKTRQLRAGEQFADGLVMEDDPGRQIEVKLYTKKNSTSQSYGGFDVLDITPQDPITAAFYDWRSFATSINLANEDIDKNSGSATKIFDFVTAHVNGAKSSMEDDIGDELLGQRAAGSKSVFGLLDLIKDDPTTNPGGGNVGDIDSSLAANSFWRNQIIDHANAAFGTDQTGTGMINLRKLFRRVQFGAKQATLGLAGESAFERIENTMVNQIRYESAASKALANAGFEAFTVKGKPIVLEKKIETVRAAAGLSGDAVYAMNLEFMKVHAMRNRWFRASNVKEPVNQDTRVSHIITRYNFLTDGRRYQGVMFDIPAV